MAKFRKKPVVIKAVQFIDDPEVLSAMSDFMGDVTVSFANPDKPMMKIETLEGVMEASEGDWIIKGVNGEFYPCKPDIFEKTYDAENDEGMSFGKAIEAAKSGSKIARKSWNGKNMFVVYMPPLYLPPYDTQGTARKVNDRTAKWIGKDKPLDCQPYFAMYNAQEEWIPGWSATQSDMLSEDWEVVE